MPRRLQLECAVGRERRFDAVDRLREARASLEHVQFGGRVDGVRHLRRAGAEAIREGEQNPANLLGLLLLERDDVVVDFDGAERLEVQARAAGRRPVHDAGDPVAVLGLHDDHVATVAFGDDLFLQVLGGVLPAQVRLERAAQPRLLLPHLVADRAQRRAGVIDDVAGRIDLFARVG